MPKNGGNSVVVRTVVLAGGRLIFAATTFLYIAALFRVMDAGSAGEVLSVQMASALIITLSRAGIERIAFESAASRSNHGYKELLRFSRRRAPSAVILSMVLFAGLNVFGGIAWGPLGVMLVGIPAWLVTHTTIAGLIAQRRVISAVLVRDTIQPIIPVLYLWIYEPSEPFEALAAVAASWVIVGASSVWILRRESRHDEDREVEDATNDQFSREVSLIHLFDVVRMYAPGLIAIAVLGASNIGGYWAAFRYGTLSATPLAIIVAAASPEIARTGMGELRIYWRVVRNASVAAAVLAVSSHALVLAAAGPLIRHSGLQGDVFGDALFTLIVISLAHSLDGIAGTSAEALVYSQNAPTERRIQATLLIIGIPLTTALTYRFGVDGAAVSYLLWLATANTARVVALRRIQLTGPLILNSSSTFLAASSLTASVLYLAGFSAAIAVTSLTMSLLLYCYLERRTLSDFRRVPVAA